MAYDIFYRDTFGKQNSYHKSNVTGKKVSQVISDYAKLQTPWNLAFFIRVPPSNSAVAIDM